MRKLVHLIIFGIVFFFTLQGCKKDEPELQHDREEVIMRKIGHEILLLSNDSNSIVRPISHEGNKYRIQFESSFSFLPDDLIKTIDTIVKSALPYDNYLVQVVECETDLVVYSYEIDEFLPFSEVVACKTREQPEACYEIVIQFIAKEKESTGIVLYILLVILLFSIGVYIYIKNKPHVNDEGIEIGAYLYNKKKMTLTLINNTIELTSKESELLNLLYESVNNTVERDTILNKVWGDEGDYVGRTLDVYISKLRKKLENDSSIQLKNIRGIGYKLIVEV
ncbi:MAG: winged helix-turn-helix transcriptional regulator [Flavobacteriales bacterium]|nr:winged helix-turn-helix transcriptional regulator [Flavobacteriales bacterium]